MELRNSPNPGRSCRTAAGRADQNVEHHRELRRQHRRGTHSQALHRVKAVGAVLVALLAQVDGWIEV